jgi:anti-sigma B factor antagonist
MRDLEITSDHRGDTAIIAVSGELDISTARRVEEELHRIEEGRPPTLVMDLRSLDFMDSTGLRLVLSADARARLEGRRLAIVPGPERVHRVFMIALLDKRLEFIDAPIPVPGAQESGP